MMDGKDKKIQLRAPRVKSIIGEIPPTIVRVGNMIITGILVVVSTLAFYLPIPWTVSCDIFINVNSNTLYIPLHENNSLSNNSIISVELNVFHAINSKPIELHLASVTDTVIYKNQLYVTRKVEYNRYLYSIKNADGELVKGKMYVRKESTPLLRRFI